MRWRGGSDREMTTPAALSAGAHVVLLAFALWGLPSLGRVPDDSLADVPIYDATEIAARSKAPTVSPERPEDRKLPEAEKNTPAPPAPTTDAAPKAKPEPKPDPKPEPQVAAVQPKPEEKPAAKPEPKVEKPKEPDAEALKPKPPTPAAERKPEPKPEPPKPEARKPEPPKPEPPKPAVKKPAPPKPTERTADQIMDELVNRAPRPPQPVAGQGKPNVPGTRTPQSALTAGQLTQSENAAMADKVRPCVSRVNEDYPVVWVLVDMSLEGYVTQATIHPDTRAAMANNPRMRAFAEAAVRAVMNPRCQPLPYPRQKYDQLRHFQFKFDPRDMR